MSIINSMLTLYTWGVICALLYFLFLIARFYEQKSGRRTFYPAFWASIGLFGVAAIRYLFLTPVVAGDFLADALRLAGGLTLGGFGLFLLKLMVGGRP
jgi:hypothetical protein